MFLGFVKSFVPDLHPMFPNYLNSLIGGIFGYGIIWSIILFYKQKISPITVKILITIIYLMLGFNAPRTYQTRYVTDPRVDWRIKPSNKIDDHGQELGTLHPLTAILVLKKW